MSMPLKFAANVNWLFKESGASIIERYGLAAAAGFSFIETADPYHIPLDELTQAKEAAGVTQVLMNAWPGG